MEAQWFISRRLSIFCEVNQIVRSEIFLNLLLRWNYFFAINLTPIELTCYFIFFFIKIQVH